MKTVVCVGGLCCAGKSTYIATTYPKGKVVDILDLRKQTPGQFNDWYWMEFMKEIGKALQWCKEVVAEAIWTDRQVLRMLSHCEHYHWKPEFYWIPVDRRIALARAALDYQQHLGDPEYTRYNDARIRIISECPVATNPVVVKLWDWNKTKENGQ